MRLKKYVLLFCLFCFAIPLVVYGVTGTTARHRADDFCHSGDIFAEGFWNAQVVVYLNSSDRFSVEPLVGISELFGPQAIRWLPGLAILLWVAGAAWAIFQGWMFFNKNNGHHNLPWLEGLLAAAALVFFSLLAAPSRFQSLYWRAGLLTYLAPLVVQTFLAGTLLWRARRDSPPAVFSLLGAGLLAFFAGGFSETTAALQAGALALALLGIGFLLCPFLPPEPVEGAKPGSTSSPGGASPEPVEGSSPELVEGETQKVFKTFWVCLQVVPDGARRNMLRLLAVALGATLLAMLALYVSPAAHLRKANFAPSPGLLEIMLISLRFGWDFLVDSVKVVPLPLAVALGFGFLLGLYKYRDFFPDPKGRGKNPHVLSSPDPAEGAKPGSTGSPGGASPEPVEGEGSEGNRMPAKASSPANKDMLKPALAMLVTLITAYLLVVCCVAPSVYVYQAGMEPRAAIAARLVTVLAAIGLGWLAGRPASLAAAHLSVTPWRLELTLLLGLALLALYPLRSAVQAAGELPDYSRRAAAWDARDAQIRADKARGLQDIETIELDATGKIGDLKADPEVWVNVCAARYYGVRTIKAIGD